MEPFFKNGKPATKYTKEDLTDIQELPLGLACCHALTTGDFVDYINKQLEDKHRSNWSPSINFRNARSASGVHDHHMAMMQRSMAICRQEGAKIEDYREAMFRVRRIAKDDIVDLAMKCEFFEELVPEAVRIGIVNYVMDI